MRVFLRCRKSTRMLADQQLLPALISWQPVHVQHDPVGESRDSIFVRFRGNEPRPKLLPFQRLSNPFVTLPTGLSKPVRRSTVSRSSRICARCARRGRSQVEQHSATDAIARSDLVRLAIPATDAYAEPRVVLPDYWATESQTGRPGERSAGAEGPFKNRYSARSAEAGSVRAARMAGTPHASPATVTSSSVTPPYTSGSTAST